MRRAPEVQGLLLAIDKDGGCTSHDVVGQVRRALSLRKVGHAGTLDPAATGVMVVGVGSATRLLGLLTQDTKGYLAEISFGVETNTDDAEGELVAEAAVPAELADEDHAREVLLRLVGPHMQVPPAFSAIKVAGKRSYARARSGESFELEPRPIEILDATLVAIDATDGVTWQVALTVSKGCYVRAIARDLGRSLGTCAHLARLRRTSSGAVRLSECLRTSELARGGWELARERCLDPVAKLGMPERVVVGADLERVRQGRPVALGGLVAAEGDGVAMTSGKRLLGVWEVRAGRLFCRVNFPEGVWGVRS